MMAQHWRVGTEKTNADPKSLSVIRHNDVTDEKTIGPIRHLLDLTKPETELNEGSPGFKEASEKARLIKTVSRSIEQNTEIYGNKKISAIIVDHDSIRIDKVTLKGIGIRYMIQDK